MKLPPAKTDAFLKSPDQGMILLYGPDAGLISERARILGKTVVDDLNDPFRVADLSFDAIKEDPGLLGAEINAISMLGGRRLIRVTTGSAALPKPLEEILSKPSDSMVLFIADDLPPSSGLRKFFEKITHGIALPCYKDDSRSVQTVVATRLREQGFRVDADAVTYLSSRFSGDRLVIISEVEKLITYMGKITHITLKDVQDCVFDSSEFSLDELCNAFASRKPDQVDRHLSKALAEGIVPVTIIRTILRYFLRLQEVRYAMANGATEEQAVAALRPPLFFKQVPVFKQHVRLWSAADISRTITRFIELETDCKTTGKPAELLTARLLTTLPLTMRG